MNKLLLIDGNSIMNRAFYGTQAGYLQNAEGLFTGAVFGFMNIFLKVLGEENPTHLLVAFDLKAPTFRHAMYSGYKATRKGMPEELAMQMPVIKEVLAAMNCACCEIAGYEADDIIGTYSRIAEEAGAACVILTGDKDSLQLVSGRTSVLLPSTKQGRTETDRMTPEAVRERLGVGPEQVIDLKALMGDASDNIPGVPGVGEKTAAALLNEYGTLDGVYAHTEEIKKPALKKKLEEGRELAFLSRTLATIERNVPLRKDPGAAGNAGIPESSGTPESQVTPEDPEALLRPLCRKPYRASVLLSLFMRLEFKQLIRKMKLQEAAEKEKSGFPEPGEPAQGIPLKAAPAQDAPTQDAAAGEGLPEKALPGGAPGDGARVYGRAAGGETPGAQEMTAAGGDTPGAQEMPAAGGDTPEGQKMLSGVESPAKRPEEVFLFLPSVRIRLPGEFEKLLPVCSEKDAEKEKSALYIDYRTDAGGTVTEATLYDGGDAFYCIELETPAMEARFFEKLGAVLSSDKVRKCFFDAKPFLLWASRNGVTVQGLWCDLSIAAYLADSTRKNGTQEEICRYFTGLDADGVGVMPYTAECAFAVLTENGMLPLYRETELPLVEVLADFERIGFCVSREVLIREGRQYEKRIGELTEQIYELAGRSFNINSPKQLGEVLFEDLRLPGGKKTKTGYKTGQEVLEKLVARHPIVPLIMEYRQNAKLKSTYIDGLLSVINPETGRVHSSFHQTVTATGRLSSSEPNLQNIPVRHELGRVIRKAFIASAPDHVLVDADYSQIELRLLADLSGDETMREAFRNGADIHAITASQVNGVPLSMVTAEMRSRAKAVNFGIVYGISEFGLAQDLHIPIAEAKQYIEGYFREYPAVRDFLRDLVAFARRTGYAETPFGRRRYLPELRSSKYMIRQFGERVAMNMPIQGAAADIMKMAMIRVYRELKARGLSARLILQVHDELLVDAPGSEEEEVRRLLKECMENVVTLSVPLPVSVTAGYCWEEAKG